MRLLWISTFCFCFLFAQEEKPVLPTDLTKETARMFTGSGNCQFCHEGKDNVLTLDGIDISPPTHWRSTMMANAARDPLWRAKVSAEVTEFPHLKQTIESKCTKCHAPMGYTESVQYAKKSDPYKGYSIEALEQSKIAQDGVSCTVCHQIQETNFGEVSSFTGGYDIDRKAKTIFGPYPDPYSWPMIDHTRFKPKQSDHINRSELCATCHTLFTPFVDNDGNIAGEFPEQVPYLEWKNSVYPAEAKNCQTCHMPQVFTPLLIAEMIPPEYQVKRTPFWQHFFVGGNTFMLKILRDHGETLGVTATTEQFNATIARTKKQLQEQTLHVSASASLENEKLKIEVVLANLAGHKLPSGIPIRRFWIHFKVKDETDTTLFESGQWDEHGEIVHLDPEFEPHYDIIENETQVQIYEGIMADVDQKVTYTLLRASQYLKDNRLPPKGFSKTHEEYDTIKIVGQASEDPNFNQEDSKEGSGKDLVTYLIPSTPGKTYLIEIEICYQSVAPRFVQHLFQFSTPEIERFKPMYQQAEKAPTILKTIQLQYSRKQ